MKYSYTLLKQLADGKFHSGQELATKLGISRSSVWQQINQLQGCGLDIYRVRSKGYKIPGGIDLLDQNQILQSISTHNSQLENLWLLPEIDSTNNFLHDQTVTLNNYSACITEYQHSGRGRNGKSWHAPIGQNLPVSIKTQTINTPLTLPCLSLIAALAVVKTLEQFGVNNLKIKWPNDIYFENKKLAGILLEQRGEISGTASITIGVGLNLKLSIDATNKLDQPVIDLDTMGYQLDRNLLTAKLIINLINCTKEFLFQPDFEHYHSNWQSYDALESKQVHVNLANENLTGIAKGLTKDGQFILQTSSGIMHLSSGIVSIKLA